MIQLIKWLSIADRYTKMHLDQQMASLGLNNSQFMYLVKICKEPGITQDQFMSYFYIHPSNVTRGIAALVKAGFVVRKKNPDDGRTHCLYPTDKGFSAREKINAICSAWSSDLLAGLSDKEQADFVALLEKTALRAVALHDEERSSS